MRIVPLVPTAILAAGSLLLVAARRQETADLRAPLSTLPVMLEGLAGRDLSVPPEEQRIAGMSSYLMRVYERDSVPKFSVYVGYYEAQLQGRSIHSPKNCLPGAGWEPVAVSSVTIPVPGGAPAPTVNRYVLERGADNSRALVYYWYQGRGRVAWNEYQVKWELLRDKALAGRSEEALVRIVVPVAPGTEATADSTASRIARELIPAISTILPTRR